jgi:hypothetical protein
MHAAPFVPDDFRADVRSPPPLPGMSGNRIGVR